MEIQTITEDKFVVSQWSGGTTVQLCIQPEGAQLNSRDFDLRISSASFTTTHSEFSDFTGYRRFILPLRGTLALRHPEINEDTIHLNPYDLHGFDGSLKTESENSEDCIDFNVIVRTNREAAVSVIRKRTEIRPETSASVFLFSADSFSVHRNEADSEDLLSAHDLHLLHRTAPQRHADRAQDEKSQPSLKKGGRRTSCDAFTVTPGNAPVILCLLSQ